MVSDPTICPYTLLPPLYSVSWSHFLLPMYPQAFHFISSIWRAFIDTSLFGLATSRAWQPLESVQQLVLLLCKQQSETVETKKVNYVAGFFYFNSWVTLLFFWDCWPELFPSIFTDKAVLIIASEKPHKKHKKSQHSQKPSNNTQIRLSCYNCWEPASKESACL